MKTSTHKTTTKRHRVFILGAGVSASAGIAVARDILRTSVVQLAESSDSGKADRVHKLLTYLYPGFEEELRNYPNIEDFLNLLEMAQKFNTEEFIASKAWSEGRLEEVKQITIKAVTEYIWERMRKKDSQRTVDTFVRVAMKPPDTIITFNWDLIIERSLENYPKNPTFEYSYSRKRKSKVFSLLKPHGSIDWFRKSVVKKLDPKTDTLHLDKELCVFPYFSRATSPKLLDAVPIIVPPVAAKEFNFEFLKKTWRGVYRAVSDATELYVIGYSLPKEDQFARLVLRRALRYNIIKAGRGDKEAVRLTVVNPDEAVGVTFSRLMPKDKPAPSFYQATLEDYLNWLEEGA